MSEQIDNRMIRKLHVLYRQCGIDEETKRTMLYDLTGGRTTRTNELNGREAAYLDGYLNGQYASAIAERRSPLKRKRSAALRRMQQVGVDTTDWQRVNAFCSDRRICGKPFYRLSEEELGELLRKLEMIKKKRDG